MWNPGGSLILFLRISLTASALGPVCGEFRGFTQDGCASWAAGARSICGRERGWGQLLQQVPAKVLRQHFTPGQFLSLRGLGKISGAATTADLMGSSR
jgi:hypothetical protein